MTYKIVGMKKVCWGGFSPVIEEIETGKKYVPRVGPGVWCMEEVRQ